MSEHDKINNNKSKYVVVPMENSKATVLHNHEDDHHEMKRKRRDKSDLGDNFVAPDGGWGWMVTVAAGLAILLAFMPVQMFGIVFRKRFALSGINSSQTTTIVNLQIALSSFTGLLNGPLFRRFTFRQVGYFGGFFVFIGLFLAAFSNTFFMFVISIDFLYGTGRGLVFSSTSMAVNTYFLKKRRTATSYQWGLAGIGPVVLPFITTYLLEYYGYLGTVMIMAGFSLHIVACAQVFQPVQWHMRKAPVEHNPQDEPEDIEVVEHVETPIVPHANDGWYGSRTSLNTAGLRTRRNSGNSQENKQNYARSRAVSVSHSIKEEDTEEALEMEMKPLDKKPLPPVQHVISEIEEDEIRQKLPFYKKVILFFDLNLCKDWKFMNLAIGLTLINFSDQNFNVLSPFILSDFGYNKDEIATVMSLLGICDLTIRFAIPTLTRRLKYSNLTYICLGTIGLCVGRIALCFAQNFVMLLLVCLWLGVFKAFRIVFWPLLIPSYVPLKRLPAASGLQLLFGGVFSLIMGPMIGLIRDKSNYVMALNFINLFSYIAVTLWIIGICIDKHRAVKAPITKPQP